VIAGCRQGRRRYLLLLAFCFGLAHAQSATTLSVQERLGYPADARLLVIHADDFGMAHSVNRAIFEAFENHWITSASILVPCPWFPEVVAWAKAHPDADLGIHLALNSEWKPFRWGPISAREKVPSLLDSDGYFTLDEDDVKAQAKIAEVDIELNAQIARARAMGIQISHLDTHMGALMKTAALAAEYEWLGRQQGLPILWHRRDAEKLSGLEKPRADFVLNDDDLEIKPGVPPQDWLAAYEKMLAPLKPGVHHLVVHLAHDDKEMEGATENHPDWGAEWRQRDFDMVKSPEFREFLRQQGFVLISWKDLARALPSDYQLADR